MLKKNILTLTLIFALVAGQFSVFADVEAPSTGDVQNVQENVEIVDQENVPQEDNPIVLEEIDENSEEETEEIEAVEDEKVIQESDDNQENPIEDNDLSENREGSNILEINENSVIFENIKLVFNGKPIEEFPSITGSSLKTGKIEYLLDWKINNDFFLVTDDYFEIKLPDVFDLGSQYEDGYSEPIINEDFEEVGVYYVQDGKLFYKHTSKDSFDDVHGKFEIELEFKKEYTQKEQEVEIKIPYEEETSYTIKLEEEKKNDAKDHWKNGEKVNADHIDWTINVNRYSKEMKDVTVVDNLPDDLRVLQDDEDAKQLYRVTYDIYGNEVKRELVDDKKINLDGNQLSVNLGNINEAYEIIIKTKYVGNIPLEGTKDKPIVIKNKATINGKDVESDVILNFGPAVTKKGKYNITDRTIEWTVVFNEDKRTLENPKFEDLFDSKYMYLVDKKEGIKVLVGLEIDKAAKIEIIENRNGKSGFEFSYDGVLGDVVQIKYKTKVKDDVVVPNNKDLINNIYFEKDKSVQGELVGFDNGYIHKSVGNVDYKNQRIPWTIEVNRSFQMMENAIITDDLKGTGHKFDINSLEVYEIKKGQNEAQKITEGYTVNFENDSKFELEFNKNTDSRYIIKIDSVFDLSKSKLESEVLSKVVKNNAELEFSVSDKKYSLEVEPKTELTDPAMNDGLKYGVYNPQTKEITWYIFTNANQLSSTTEVIDTISGNQEFIVPFSLEYSTYEMNSSGNIPTNDLNDLEEKNFDFNIVPESMYVSGGEPKITSTGDKSNNTLTFKVNNKELGNEKYQSYVFKFKTSLKGKTVDSKYKNNATLKNDKGNVTEVEKTVNVPHGGKFIVKNSLGSENNNVIHKWELVINPSQSFIKDVIVKDNLDSNQLYIKDSIEVYEAKVRSSDKIKEKVKKLEKGLDYEIEFYPDPSDVKDNETESFELRLAPNGKDYIEKSYIIEYSVAYFKNDSDTKVLKNIASVEGNLVDKKLEQQSVENSSEEIKFSGLSFAKNATISVEKKGHNNTPLEGVEFEFYLLVNGKEVLQKTAVTDGNGNIELPKMRSGKYIIKETKALDGYIPLEDQEAMIKSGENNIKFENQLRSFELKKLSLNSTSVEDTEFEVYYSRVKDGNDYEKLETNIVFTKDSDTIDYNNNGKGLLEGFYKLKEVKTNDQLILNTKELDFELTEEGKVLIDGKEQDDIEFINYQGSVELSKIDAETEKALKGVSFDLFKLNPDQKETLVSNHTTDEEGKIKLDSLAPGEYYFQETKTLDGYVMDSTQHKFEIVKEFSGQPESVKINIKNYRGEARLMKLGSSRTENGLEFIPLEGAEFSLYKDGSEEAMQVVVSDSEGNVIFENLSDGNYKVIETKAPKGYIRNSEIYSFTINEGASEESELKHNLGEVRNIKASFILNKYEGLENQDIDTSEMKKLEGANFNLHKVEGSEKSLINDRLVSNASGTIEINDLEPGKYELSEVLAADGYFLNYETIEFEIPESMNVNELEEGEYVVERNFFNYKSNLMFIKEDKFNNPLEGAEFTLYLIENDERVQELATVSSNEQGEVIFSNVSPGEYEIEETKAPNGYQLSPEIIKIKLENTDSIESIKHNRVHTFKLENFLNGQGSVELRKMDENGNPLEGATYELYTIDGVKKEGLFTSNEDGVIKIENALEPGYYYFKEVKAPEGYLINDEIIEFNISLNHQDEAVQVSHINYQADIKFRKIDENNNPLENVEFELLDSNDNIVDQAKSLEDGTVSFNEVKPGIYKIRESKTVEDYIINTKELEIEIPVNFKGKYELELEDFINYQGKVRFTKIDEKENPLAGALFALFDEEGNEVNQARSDKNGNVEFDEIAPGKYTVKELESVSGYILNTKEITFEIADAYADEHLLELDDFINYQGKVRFTKIDEKENPLAGALFALFDEEGNEVNQARSNKDGNVEFDEIAPGKYTVKELESVSGYILNTEEIKFEIVDACEEEYLLELDDFTNYQGTVVIHKVDEDNKHITSSSAIFNILDKDKNIIHTVETKDGIVSVLDLSPGTYYIQEVKAPEGFELMESLVEFHIANEYEGALEDLNIDVINKTIKLGLGESEDPKKPDAGENNIPETGQSKLPSTGQSNTAMIASAILLGLGFILRIFTRKED